jgi:hypothetical protein
MNVLQSVSQRISGYRAAMGNEQSNSDSETKPTEGESAVSTKERDQRRRAAYENRSRRNTFQMPSPVEQKYAKKVQVQVPLTKIRFSIEERVDVCRIHQKTWPMNNSNKMMNMDM